MTAVQTLLPADLPARLTLRRPESLMRTPAKTPFIQTLELIAATRTEAQRKRPKLDRAFPVVRLTVNAMRWR
jgi:hypothetical protein